MEAVVFFADGFEDIEALSPVDYLRRANIEVLTVGVKGYLENINGTPKMIVTSSHNVPMIMDCTLNDYLKKYNSTLPDCIICPGGGKGAQNLSECKNLLKHIEQMNIENKLICAICASPAVVLGKTNVLENKKWTCYPQMQEYAKKEYQTNYSNQVVISDKNLITSRGPGSSEQFAMEIVKTLCGTEIYNNIKTNSQQR